MAHGFACSLIVTAALLSRAPPIPQERNPGVPFELFQQHLVVTKGSIGSLSKLNLLIDTGTIPSVIDARVARRLNLQTAASLLVAFGQQVPIESAVVEGFQIGSLRTGAVPAMVGDLSYLSGVRIDAIVGLDVLARASLAIDYESQMLTIGLGPRDELGAPMEVRWPFVTVQMTIAGAQVRLLVDTGSADLVLFKTRLPAALDRAPWRGDKTVQYASGAARLVRLELRHASLGAHVWDTLPAWSLDRALDNYPASIDGVLGVRALGCRRVSFDFEGQRFHCGR
jgi:predicted aspartyl protease